MAEKYYRQNKLNRERGVIEGNILTTRGTTVNQADAIELSHTAFGEVIHVEKHPIINLQPHHGISQKRDYIKENGIYQIPSFTGSARVTNANGIHTVKVTGASQQTHFETAQTGIYISGYMAETGVGTIVPDEVPEGIKVYWGYFDDMDGFGYYKDHTGLYVFVKSGGTTEYIGQTANQEIDTTADKKGWNADTLDGSGGLNNSSGIKINTSRGWMYQNRFLHYGMGAISFYINILDKSGIERKILIHKFERPNEILFQNPNLPLSVHVESDASYTGGEFGVRVAGRQMSVLGEYIPMYRTSNEDNRVTGVTDTWVPVVSAKLKSDRRGIQLFADYATLTTTQDIKWGIFLNGELGGTPNFQAPINTTSNTRNSDETSVEFDITATSITEGVMLFGDTVKGGERGNESGEDESIITSSPIPRDRIVTLAVRRKGDTNADVWGKLKVREEY